MSRPPYAAELGLQLCHDCGHSCPLDSKQCPRCWSALHARKPNSINRTWALLIGALILYLPANLIPVMYTDMLGNGSESTILSGVISFWRGGSWDIALLIFIASVGVPCIKFFVLGLLLVTTQRRSRWAMQERARLFRFIEVIGYWSMLDVLVVALVAALVQFRALGTIEPRMGILFFGLVVVLTMLASMSFDPRLIWDAEKTMSDNTYNHSSPPAPVDVPEIRQRRMSVSLVWLVPIVAALVGLSMVVQNWLSAGPQIQVSFLTAEGLEANKTQVKYKNVVIGRVTEITLSKDRTRVVATIELDQNTEAFIREDAKFWVVRPRIGAGGVSGVDTLLSGSFIGADPGHAAESRREFTGLEAPPPVTFGVKGKRFTLQTNDLGSLDIGSPVYYRRIPVGQVVSYALSEDGKGVDTQIFIHAPYDDFVTQHTRFWNASGVDVSLGADGFKVNTQSLSSIVAGGIAFRAPVYLTDAEPVAEHSEFVLFDDMEKAMAPNDGPARYVQMRFEQTLRGLNVDAPVELLGVPIGRVVSVKLDYDEQQQSFPVVVGAVIYPSRLGEAHDKLLALIEGKDEEDRSARLVQIFVEQGLRAQARTGNLLTGQLYISLDFNSRAPAVTFDPDARPLVIPTTPGSFDKLQEQLQGLVDKLGKLPIESMANNLDSSLNELRKTLQQVNSGVLPQLQSTLERSEQTLQSVNQALAEGSPQRQQVGDTLEEVQRAVRSVRVLTDYLNRHPESLIRGRGTADSPASFNGAATSRELNMMESQE